MGKMGTGLIAVVIYLAGFSNAALAGRDLTFFAWTDSHHGAYDWSDKTRLNIIQKINNMPNTAYPSYIGGKVGQGSFLLHLGDLTEHGYATEWNNPGKPDQWSYLQTIKHLNPALRTYETMGNHDGKTNEIAKGITAKQGNTYYSFSDQGVHFVVLDPYKKHSITYPDLDDEQLNWLKSDLDALAPQTPIIFAMHMCPDTTSGGDRSCHLGNSSQKLANVIRGKNVLAFMNGHWHTSGITTNWNGINVIRSGFSYMRSGCPNGSPIFDVVKITDNHLYLMEYNWDTNQWGRLLISKDFVPEPATLGLFGVAGLGWLARRRKTA